MCYYMHICTCVVAGIIGLFLITPEEEQPKSDDTHTWQLTGTTAVQVLLPFSVLSLTYGDACYYNISVG